MREIWKNADLKSKAAIIISSIAMIAAVADFWTEDERVRIIVWASIIVVWGINYLILLEQNNKLLKNLSEAIFDSMQWKGCLVRIESRINLNDDIPEEVSDLISKYFDEEIENTLKRCNKEKNMNKIEWKKWK